MKVKGRLFWGAAAVVAVSALALTSCAPQTSNGGGLAETGDGGAVSAEWSFEGDCGICHDAQQATYEVADCLVGSHPDQRCVNCHTDQEVLAEIHDGVTGEDKTPKRLKKTEVSADACLSCHGSEQELAQKTAEATCLTDKNGTVVNPHDLPDVPDHDKVTCTSCHIAHEPTERSEAAYDACLTCHHAEVYECYTCHD